MEEKQSKNSRILSLYARLSKGYTILKDEEAERYKVDERTIQRDIDDIRAFLEEQKSNNADDQREIVYSRQQGGFVMREGNPSLMSNSEILAVSKILLDSRAFTKKEICEILDKLIAGCVPEKNVKMISDLIANEKYHYAELSHKKEVKDILWDLGEDIRKKRLIKIRYEKLSKEKKAVTYIVEPVGLIFSEYYFYLNAFIDELSDKEEHVHKYQYPAIFRLDRIIERKDTGNKFTVEYSNRFEEGEFRKRIQFMFAGELIKVRFKYYGLSIDAVMDRLPTAKIIEKTNEYYMVEAEVYGKGIVMWLMSQGKNVEVVKPKDLRIELKNQCIELLDYYRN